MNELGIRKLPRDDDGPDPDKVFQISYLSQNMNWWLTSISNLTFKIFLTSISFRAYSRSLKYHKSWISVCKAIFLYKIIGRFFATHFRISRVKILYTKKTYCIIIILLLIFINNGYMRWQNKLKWWFKDKYLCWWFRTLLMRIQISRKDTERKQNQLCLKSRKKR